MSVSAEAKVGIMIFVSLIILASMTFTVSKISLFKKPGDKIKIQFEDTGGLRLYDDVRIAGVIVGKVVDIYLEGANAIVVIQLKPEFHIRKGAKVIINSAGLLGEAYIGVTQGPEKEPFLTESSPPILSEPTVRVDQVMASMNRFMDRAENAMNFDVRQVIKNTEDLIATMNLLVNENRANIKEISGNMGAISKGLTETQKEFQTKLVSILSNVDQYSQTLFQRTIAISDEMLNITKDLDRGVNKTSNDVSALINNFNETSTEFNKIVKTLAETMKKIDNIAARVEKGEGVIGKLTTSNELYDNLNGVLIEIKGISTSLNQVAGRIERGEGTIGKLTKEDTLYKNLDETIASVRDLTGRVNEYRTYWGYRMDYRFIKQEDQKDFSNTFSFRFDPRPGKYYLLELTDIGGKEKVSLLIGAAVKDWLTLKAGVIQSTGGVGLNYYPFGKDFNLGVSAFDFGRLSKPQVKVEGSYQLTKNVYFNVGAEDLLLDKSYYAGLNVFIEDRDIKYLLGLVPYVK
ncbi:MAG: MlaD family protein [bacterium]|nr:MlaD family protein [bacterium]